MNELAEIPQTNKVKINYNQWLPGNH